MEKILVINYYWPPSGGPAVQRWLSFVKRLPEFDIEPVVLTVDEKFATYPVLDETLVKEVPTGTQVHKTKTKELYWLYKRSVGRGKVPTAAFANESKPGPLKKIARFIRGNFFIPDPRKPWKKYALPTAIALMRDQNIKVFATAGPPHSTHLIGLQLQKETGTRWIADIHDAWTDISYYKEFMQLPFARKKDARYELSVLENADAVLTLGPRLARKLASKSSKIDPNKIHVISMGYDENLFENKSVETQTDRFIITYVGTMADFYKPEVFLDALRAFFEKNPDAPCLMRFVGMVSNGVKDYISEIGIEDKVEYIPFVPHKKSVAYLHNASVLLQVNPHFEGEERHIPGKIYEYLAARKPIINIAPADSDVAEIVANCESGKTFERTDEVDISAYLNELYNLWARNKQLDLQSRNNSAYTQYSRHNETMKLGKIIHGLL